MAKAMLICGRICSGKSHYAALLRDRENAVILSCDELTFVLFDGQLGDAHDRISSRMERYFMEKSVEIIRAGRASSLTGGSGRIKAGKTHAPSMPGMASLARCIILMFLTMYG